MIMLYRAGARRKCSGVPPAHHHLQHTLHTHTRYTHTERWIERERETDTDRHTHPDARTRIHHTTQERAQTAPTASHRGRCSGLVPPHFDATSRQPPPHPPSFPPQPT